MTVIYGVVAAVRGKGKSHKKNDTADIRTSGYRPRPIMVSMSTILRGCIVSFLVTALPTMIPSIKVKL